MRLDRAGIIAGRPIKQVRDFLRIQRDSPASSDRVARFFDVDLQAAKSIIDAMLERKLIAETSAPWDPQMVVYEVTGLGLRFAAARLLKPISRKGQTMSSVVCSLASRR